MNELKFYRILLLLTAIVSNALRVKNHLNYVNTSSALGGFYLSLAYSLIALIIAIIICFAINWKKMKKLDFLLLFLCLPLPSLLIILFI